MKYIRTKDKIYIANKINGKIIARGDVAYSCESADIHLPIIIKEKDIIKQADTIEELCDEFVVIRGDCKCLYKQSDIFDCQDKNAVNDLIKNNQIYGAIWTECGLKYVAKMNDKGELELL